MRGQLRTITESEQEGERAHNQTLCVARAQGV